MHAGHGRAWQRSHLAVLARDASWAHRKKHSLIRTPRVRMRRLQAIAALTCLCGIVFRFAAPHSPVLAMGPGNMQWSCQPNCCSDGLRVLPRLQERSLSRCVLASRISWHSPQRPASSVCTRMPWYSAPNGRHAHIYAFRKHEGVALACAVCLRCTRSQHCERR